MNKKEDIFDRIMSIKILKFLNPLYKKYKEILLYLFFGALTMVVSIGTYWLFSEPLKINVLISNILSWIFAVTFAYITNKIWVFDNVTNSFKELLKEIIGFFSGRLTTLFIEEIILLLFIEKLHYNNMVVKLVAQVVVIVLNYFISKFIVFRKSKSKDGEKDEKIKD